MGGGFINGIQTGNTIYHQHLPLMAEDNRSRPDFDWDRRSPRAAFQPNPWTHLWPRSGMMAGDMTTPWGLLGDDGSEISGWGPWEVMGKGNQSTKFFLGSCVDVSDVAVANATVQGFRTSDDAFVGEVTADAGGKYALGVNAAPAGWLPSQTHYLVAYKTGAPDTAGTTVNTLTPTNIDGS